MATFAVSFLSALAIAVVATTEARSEPKSPGACVPIRDACLQAGFVEGAAKTANGLIQDCFNPLVKGSPQPRRANIPLPAIEPQVLAACRAAVPATPKAALLLPVITPTLTPGNHPNIVFILADDFSMSLISSGIFEQSMPNLAAMMHDGATFENYFVTDSLCCPSRSSIFTGKLPHDSGVFTNTPPFGGFEGFNAHGNEAQTFAVALQRAGYRTAMLGKYLNGYKPAKDKPPAGWNEWDVAGNGYPQFNYALNENGKLVKFGDRSDTRNYLTDVVSELGQQFIRKSAAGPFVIEIATFAPHAPYVPAPRNDNDFPSLSYSRASPFGARPDAAAPDWLKAISPLTEADIAAIDKNYRMRVQSDEAIDKMIGEVRGLLVSLRLDGNTYVVFSSDNGYHMGEYSLRAGKMTSFDTDIHVPLVIVGPGVSPGRRVSEISENIDLFPTFLEFAHAASPGTADGRSLAVLVSPPGAPSDPWRSAALVEHRHPGKNLADPDNPEPSSGNPPSYEALRTADAMYVEYDDPKREVGLYDLKADPLELHNLSATIAPKTLARWHEILKANSTCRGAEACWAAQKLTPP